MTVAKRIHLVHDPAHSDHEQSAQTSHTALKLWLRLLACTTLIEDEIRKRLRVQFDTTLPRFDLMAQLDRCPEGLRMGELSKRLMVTSGNVTGITDQLESEGLVARVADPQDRRVYSVQLTAAGRTAFARMAAFHETWVEELTAGLTAAEQAQLNSLLSKLKHQAQAH